MLRYDGSEVTGIHDPLYDAAHSITCNSQYMYYEIEDVIYRFNGDSTQPLASWENETAWLRQVIVDDDEKIYARYEGKDEGDPNGVAIYSGTEWEYFDYHEPIHAMDLSEDGIVYIAGQWGGSLGGYIARHPCQ